MTKNNREIPEKNVRNEIKKMKISHKSGINVKHMNIDPHITSKSI